MPYPSSVQSAHRQLSLVVRLRRSVPAPIEPVVKSLAENKIAARAYRARLRRTQNPLEVYFRANQGRLIHKWIHYFDIYDRHFSPYRGRKVNIVEFGVSHGGSLQMWRDYFGHRATITGVDVDPRCAKFTGNGVNVVIGDQENRKFLNDLADRVGGIDIVIDDGGHTMGQQIATFEELWPRVRDGGIFLVEDLHTSYWPKYDGGYKRSGTFIEYAKNLIDQQHAWHSRDLESFKVDDYTRSIRGMHIYDSVIVFDKEHVSKPMHEKTGKPSF
jgi:Methyltransferase domain